jgi:Transglycosylase SLT domain
MRTLAIATMITTTAIGVGVVAVSSILIPMPQMQAQDLGKPFTMEDIKQALAQDLLIKKIAEAEEVAIRVYEAHGCYNYDLAHLTALKSVEHGVPVRLLAGLIFVESSCNSYARSDRHACGLMQVNSKVWHVSCADLMEPETGIEIGTRIFASYKSRWGLRGGLHHYLGMGTDDGNITGDEYANKVLMAAGYRQPELVN